MSHSTKRSYAVVGSGAVGALYGSQLYKYGHPIQFLVRSSWSLAKEAGIFVHSPTWGDVTIPPCTIVNTVTSLHIPDVLIIATKATENHTLPHLLAPLLHAQRDKNSNKNNNMLTIVCLQNGLDMEHEMASLLDTPNNNSSIIIVGGVCFLCSNRKAPNHIVHVDYGKIILGIVDDDGDDNKQQAALQQVAEDFYGARVPIEVSKDMKKTRWKKLCWNIPFNGLSVVADAETDVLMMTEPHRRRAEAIMREVVALSIADGHGLEDGVVEEMMEMTEKMKPYASSMRLDALGGRALELEAMYGRVLRRAEELGGVDVKEIKALYKELKAFDCMNTL